MSRIHSSQSTPNVCGTLAFIEKEEKLKSTESKSGLNVYLCFIMRIIWRNNI